MTTKTAAPQASIVILLIFIAFSALVLVAMPHTNMQMTDHKGLRQPLICDGVDHTLVFSNFVTAHSWLDQIRWAKDGSSYTISTHFTTGTPFALTYSCK